MAKAVGGGFLFIFALIFGLLFAGGGYESTTEAEAAANGKSLDEILGSVVSQPGKVTVSVDGFDRWSSVQMSNAAAIMLAGLDLCLSDRDQQIAIMTAIGESDLLVLDHGDKAGPDSRGLFQQRSQGWGTLEQRMDPYASSVSFYTALMKISDRKNMSPTLVAHKVQINANPNHYTKFFDPAVKIHAHLKTVKPKISRSGVADSSDWLAKRTVCGAFTGSVSSNGWTLPMPSKPASNLKIGPKGRFGMRDLYGNGQWKMHHGIDLPGSRFNTPIYAASDGIVKLAVSPNNKISYGNQIVIDHGGGIKTRYAHLNIGGVLVKPGQKVVAGQQIGLEGSTGHSTGPHLHFEVIQNGKVIDPVPFLQSKGLKISY